MGHASHAVMDCRAASAPFRTGVWFKHIKAGGELFSRNAVAPEQGMF